MEMDHVVVVVEVGQSGCEVLVEEVEGVDWEDAEADERNVGDAGLAFHSVATFWVRWARRVRVRLCASGVGAHFFWCSVSLQMLVLWAVSCAVSCGVMK